MACGAVVRNICVSAVQLIIIVVDGEGSRFPIGLGRVAHGTVIWNGQCRVIRIDALVKVRLVASHTGIRCVVVIATDVAEVAIICDSSMRSSQWINRVVVKIGRYPFNLRVTLGAIRGELSHFVVGVGGVLIFRLVAAIASVGGVVIVAVVACGAVVRNICVSAVQLIIIVVDGEGGRLPFGLGRVAHGTVGRNIQ